MKMLSAQQIRDWDEYTIQHEPVTSIDLMERAAAACVKWIVENLQDASQFQVFCGSGNNGGDGLAIARMLREKGKEIEVYLLETAGSADFNTNLQRASAAGLPVTHMRGTDEFPLIKNGIAIDALFGTGLNRPVSGVAASLINHLNRQKVKLISIDIPSGMFADQSSKDLPVIQADITLSFQVPKLAFFMADQGAFVGQCIILDIGLHPDYLKTVSPAVEFTDSAIIAEILQPRNPFANKGTYGHAALLAGSYGMMGAAILAARACLRSGAGKLTCYIPKLANTIMQLAVPEAILQIDSDEMKITRFDAQTTYQAVGVGPGIGQFREHLGLLREMFRRRKPLVIDADALNTLAAHQELTHEIPSNSILTPHPREMERLFGASTDDFARMKLAMQRAQTLDVIIVLKGHYTLIAFPDGRVAFNSTGNSGMAKAGSGDVLTGLLTGLMARGYNPKDTAILGVFLHGLAGDLAKKEIGEEAMQSSDIIDFLPKAFLSLSPNSRF